MNPPAPLPLSFLSPVRLAAVAALLLAPTGLPLSAREPGSDVVARTNTMVAMRDGVELATDLYLPAKGDTPKEGRYPVILSRTPYNKDGQRSYGEYYAARGYVFVAQDTRGRWNSEGIWRMLVDDGPDGQDTADWIAAQEWSDGQIGMIGVSYFGGTQHALATAGSPHLKTVIPADAMSNMGHQSMRNGGAFELRFWNWILINAARGNRHAEDPGKVEALETMSENRGHYLRHLPLRRGTTPLRLAPEYEEWLVGAMENGANNDYWRQNNLIDHPGDYQDIPVYLVGGWYDSWAGNTTANYRVLSRAIQKPVYMIMGPWIHNGPHGHQHGQVSFGKEAAIPDHRAWRLEWYDHWLKGIDNKVGKEAPFATPVRIFVMGTGDGSKTEKGLLQHGGYWRDENDWPLERAEIVPYYLHEDGTLSASAPEAADASTTYLYDPADPVPSIGGQTSSGNDLMLSGAYDQRGGEHMETLVHHDLGREPVPLSARRDVLVFQSEPLEEDLEVTGELEVKLWASSSAVDTDFTAKLIDVYPPSEDWPDGFDLMLGDGIVRARFRDSLEEEKLMEPGEVYPFTIKLYPTSNVFKKGHRIRVDISSSNYPRFDLNPNTGEPLNDHRRVATAENTLYHDRERPSRILLPVVP
ncbi:MAG: CocE/NonD family hydrolase [Verrucomicrobiales bacterium]